jgi:hypothetical protein
MQQSPDKAAKHFFGAEWPKLSAHEREVIEAVLHRIELPRDANRVFEGQRMDERLYAIEGRLAEVSAALRQEPSGPDAVAE